jgi:putative two-component system response regulator
VQKTIFVVDDNDTNLSMAKEALRAHYRVLTMPSATKMFALLEKITPDLILLDIEMPEMDGFEALQALKNDEEQAKIPVIFLTSMTDVSVEVRGFELGVIDFVTKPFSAPVLNNRIKTHLGIDEMIRERTLHLQEKTQQLQNLKSAIIFGFADLVENRDKNTGGHVERTAAYIELLTKVMIERGLYAEELKDLDMDLFVSSARLHDVGKIAISDTILNKPGKLTDEEFVTMKSHTTEGEMAIDQIATRSDDKEFLHNARLFAGSHHERWDGRGYPRGLAGDQIPLQGRIMAIADVYDALVSERPYKKAFTTEQAVDIITEGSGTQFEAAIVDLFIELKDQFEMVRQKY